MRGYWLSQTMKCMKHYQSAGAQPAPVLINIFQYLINVASTTAPATAYTGDTIVYSYSPYTGYQFYGTVVLDVNYWMPNTPLPTPIFSAYGVATGTFVVPRSVPNAALWLYCVAGVTDFVFNLNDSYISGGADLLYGNITKHVLTMSPNVRRNQFSVTANSGHSIVSVTATIRNPQQGQQANIPMTVTINGGTAQCEFLGSDILDGNIVDVNVVTQ